MARNRNRKQRTHLNSPAEEETTSVRESARKGPRADEVRPSRPRAPNRHRTFPTGAPLAGSAVLEAVGSNGTVGRAMHDVIHTPDDEKVVTRLGPEQEASVEFHADRALADAGAEFAEDFGRGFLMAATTGEDIGEIASESSSDASILGDTFLHVTDELEDLTGYAESADDDESPAAKR